MFLLKTTYKKALLMQPTLIKTSAWGTQLPEDHLRVSISRGTPRRTPAGFRVYRALAPGPWFNKVGTDEYCRLYAEEILAPLDPRLVADALVCLGDGRVPVLLCFERPNTGKWCHRALVAEWLAKATGRTVPEFGFEALPQHAHPLLPPGHPRLAFPTAIPSPEIEAFAGRTATIDGELHRVVGADPDQPGRAIIAAGDRRFSTSLDTLHRQFAKP